MLYSYYIEAVSEEKETAEQQPAPYAGGALPTSLPPPASPRNRITSNSSATQYPAQPPGGGDFRPTPAPRSIRFSEINSPTSQDYTPSLSFHPAYGKKSKCG